MRRREFIGLIGGAAALPLKARAQQQAMPVIGFLDTASPGPMGPFLAMFRQGLLESGFVEGKNVAIEYRWGENHNDRLSALAANLVERHVAVIAAINLAPVLAAQAATKAIPIVFGIGGDPVALGLVTSFNHPGGNLTGITQQSIEAFAKRLQLLHELIPAATSIAFLTNPDNKRNVEVETAAVNNMANRLGLRLPILNASSPSELDAAFATIAEQRVGALLVSSDPFFVGQRDQLVALAALHAVPASYFRRDFAVAGGLMSYGSSLTDGYRQVGAYIGQILKGAKPADLPVQQPTKFEFVINQKAAKALGLTIPPALVVLADEVIE
jgi:ABC-type uncharacterized transport system substrate-binding protein